MQYCPSSQGAQGAGAVSEQRKRHQRPRQKSKERRWLPHLWIGRRASRGGQTLVLTEQTLLYPAAFGPDCSHVVTASGDKTVHIWDAAILLTCIKPTHGKA